MVSLSKHGVEGRFGYKLVEALKFLEGIALTGQISITPDTQGDALW